VSVPAGKLGGAWGQVQLRNPSFLNRTDKPPPPAAVVWHAADEQDRVVHGKYRTRDGRQRWFTIGRHGSPWTPELARREAQRLLGAVANGEDPAAAKQETRGAATFAAFAERYLADHAIAKKKASSIRMDRINLAKHILASLGRRTLNEISRADIARLHSGMRQTPGAANRCLALLSKMMNLAEGWGLRPDGSNPCRHIQKYSEHSRKRYLSTEELLRLGAACTEAEREELPYFAALVRLLIFTGARLSEIQKARWDAIDFGTGSLRLADSKTGAKTVILPAPALELLAHLPRVDGNPHVIPGEGGRYLVNVWKPWNRLRTLAKLPDIRLHDLRHSFASVGAASGMSLNIIGGLLGHTQAQTTKRYAHLATDPLKAAANQIADTIAAAMRGNAAQVVPIRQRTAL
jgi:integrase